MSDVHERIREHWDSEAVESMYDKHLLAAEIDVIAREIPPGSRVLDVGCGEGEGTAAYSRLPGVLIHGIDFSETRLLKARERVGATENVLLDRCDLLRDPLPEGPFDRIVSQRFLINIPTWDEQQRVLARLLERLAPGGRLLLLEGSKPGVEALNAVRHASGLPEIGIQWHNAFLDDGALGEFLGTTPFKVHAVRGLGAYFVLTRAIRPLLDSSLHWDSEFNRIAASLQTSGVLEIGDRYSRLKLWVIGPRVAG